MSSLHQTLPLNHPPPLQPTSQPPLKKPRINAKPKLTTHQITQPTVIQSALRIGRQARANAPQPAHQHKALDTLLKHMQTWASQLAPQYTLAEFVLAANAISGNRELRPMLAEFRLAQLRDVNAGNDPDNDPENDASEPAQVDDSALNVVQSGNNAVHAQVAPVEADVGPVEADVGPDADDWDELDLVPHEAVKIRPIRNNHNEHTLSPHIEAKIEQNRRAAVERRKAVIARLRADKDAEENHSKQHADTSHQKSTMNPAEAQEQENTKPELKAHSVSNASPSAFEKGKHLSQKLNPSDDHPSSESVKTPLKEHGYNPQGEHAKHATNEARIDKQAQTDAAKQTKSFRSHISETT